MRNIALICLLALSSCGQPPTSPTISEVATVATQTVKWEVIPGVDSSKAMSTVNWRCTITNHNRVQSDWLVISMLDAKGETRAEWDVECKLLPGESITKTGVFDVPEYEIAKITKVIVDLVVDPQD